MRLCGLAEYICFSQDVNIKVALSSLQLNIIGTSPLWILARLVIIIF